MPLRVACQEARPRSGRGGRWAVLAGWIANLTVGLPSSVRAADSDLRLELESAVYAYAHDSREDSTRLGASIRVEPSLRVEWTAWQLQLAAVARADNLDYVRSDKLFDAAGDQDSRITLDYGESFLSTDWGSWGLRAGKLLFAWGTADGVNPVDVLNPRDYTDIIDFEKVPVDAVSLTYYGEMATLTAVVLPGFQPSRLPSPGSRFFPAAPRTLPVDGEDVPLELELRSAKRFRPDTSGTALPFAIKADGTLRGIDWFVSYYQGATRDGLVRAGSGVSIEAGLARVPIERVFPRQRILGGGFAGFWGRLRLRGEIAHFEDLGDQGDDYVQAVFGGDRRWPDLIGEVDVGVNVQYAIDRRRSRGRVVNQTPAPMSRVFSDNLLLRVDFELDPDTGLRFEGTLNTEDDDGFCRMEFTTRVKRAWNLTVGGDAFFGSSDGFFSQFQRNDRIFFKVTTVF